ncbi:hypothetical protein UJ101_00659 [Flavobacteriaceae bacterium UJ101]|nr:hypothetical protein UJ101_00659 [Flavobacteriaceae bacterium UJ101]
MNILYIILTFIASILLNYGNYTYDINLKELDSHNAIHNYKALSENSNSQNLFIQYSAKNYSLENVYLENYTESEEESINNDHTLYDYLYAHYNKTFLFYKSFSLTIYKRFYYFSDSIPIRILHQVFLI